MLLLGLVCLGVAGDATCPNGMPFTGPAVDLLRGTHLKVLELEWPPYASKSPSAPLGWTGYDIDLFSEVASILGFTFEIGEEPMLSGETYTQMLLRTVHKSDLWLSWWLRTEERMNASTMLLGHVDSSPVLIAPPPQAKSGYVFDTFFRPFSYPLWGCIILMIVCSGLIDFFLEYGYGGTLQSSIYEYFGGVLWGGFQDPHTRLSAVFQVFNALIVMILVAAYTANLASFMTISNTPSISFGSVQDLIAAKTSVCSIGSYGSQTTLEATYSDVLFDTTQTGYTAVGDALVDGQCKAAILPKVDYDTLATVPSNCQLSIVGASLYFSTAGWVTAVNNSMCIQRPIEYALHLLQGNGKLAEIFAKWHEPAACEAPSSRRLEEVDSASRPAPHRPESARRLASVAAVASASSGDDDGLTQMTPEQFLGVFVLWGAAAGCVILVKLGLILHNRFVMKEMRATVATTTAEKPEHKDEVEEIPGMGSSYPEGLDINNTSAMLRYLVLREHAHAVEGQGMSVQPMSKED